MIGPGASIELPDGIGHVDAEAELAIVIGATARRLSPADALDAVAGYTVANDVSAREAQSTDGQWFRAKGYDTFCPILPSFVEQREIGDGRGLRVTQRLNGAVMQDGSTDDLIFDVPTLVAYCSSVCTLEPGDLILTGTPGGVGYFRTPRCRSRPVTWSRWRSKGIGTVSNPVAAAGDGERSMTPLDDRRQPLDRERFLVTGAYGCIGAWTLRQLVREGVEVIGVDAGDDDHRVRELLGDDELEAARFLKADVSIPRQVADAVRPRADAVIHLAALQVPDCRSKPVLGAQVNVVGTVALFVQRSRTACLRRSSTPARSRRSRRRRRGPHPAHQAVTLKRITACSRWRTKVRHECSRSRARSASIGLRPYVVYGACRDSGLASATTAAMHAAARGHDYTIPFSGSCEMQFAPDTAAAFIAAASAPFTGAAVVNVPGTT